MTTEDSHQPLVEGTLSWLRAAARGFHRAHNGVAPSVAELIAEGTVVLVELAPRYDPQRGAAFSTFSYRHVLTRWRRMRERELREQPVGGVDDVLELLRVEGSVMDQDDAHMRRTTEFADIFFVGRTLDNALELRRILRFIEQLPKPQPDLLLGLFRDGQTIAQLMRELDLNRGQARWQLRKALGAVIEHFAGDHD